MFGHRHRAVTSPCEPAAPNQAKQKSWFQAVVALYRLALDWSLETLILGKAVELTHGTMDQSSRMEVATCHCSSIQLSLLNTF